MEYLRPWKLVSFFIGVSLLIVGSFYYGFRDWDTALSIIMATLTYLTAPKAVHALFRPSLMGVTGALFWWIFTVDASYVIYNSVMGNMDFIVREENFTTSSCLYWMCGLMWSYNGNLEDLG